MKTTRIAVALLLPPVLGTVSHGAEEAHGGCSTLVPIELTEKSEALVTFLIQDQEVQLFLDTGNATAGIDLNPNALETVAVSFSGSTRKVTGWRGDRVEERVYTIPEVRLGDLVMKDVHGHEYRVRPELADGSFSFAAFPECNVLVDLPRKRFGLFPRTSVPAFLSEGGWNSVPFQPSADGGVELALTLEAVSGTFVLGLDNAAISIDNAGRHYNLIRARSPLGQHLQEHDQLAAVDEPAALGAFASDRFFVAGRCIGSLRFMIVDYPFPEIDGLLGSAFFRDFSVFIDFSRQELHLKPHRTPN